MNDLPPERKEYIRNVTSQALKALWDEEDFKIQTLDSFELGTEFCFRHTPDRILVCYDVGFQTLLYYQKGVAPEAGLCYAFDYELETEEVRLL